jgi:hypothetical protein
MPFVRQYAALFLLTFVPLTALFATYTVVLLTTAVAMANRKNTQVRSLAPVQPVIVTADVQA